MSAARRPGSIRRTSCIDSTRPDGFDRSVVLHATARDLRTEADGSPSEVGSCRVDAVIDLMRTIEHLETEPGGPEVQRLVGASTAGGFRARLADALPADTAAGSLRNLVLDDLPGATLVSGVALQAVNALPIASDSMRLHILASAGICAGWVGDGTMLDAFREHDQVPAPVGPPAPTLERPDDPDGWPPVAALPRHATRRRRLLDVWPEAHGSATHAFAAHFRDSHMTGDGVELVVHEYEVTGRVDAAAGTFTAIVAEARVLPWPECPNALASAGRLLATPYGDLRRRVRTEFTGVSTCTHLNDTLRTLADLAPLVDGR